MAGQVRAGKGRVGRGRVREGRGGYGRAACGKARLGSTVRLPYPARHGVRGAKGRGRRAMDPIGLLLRAVLPVLLSLRTISAVISRSGAPWVGIRRPYAFARAMCRDWTT